MQGCDGLGAHLDFLAPGRPSWGSFFHCVNAKVVLAKDGDEPLVANFYDGDAAAVFKARQDVGVARLWGHGHV